MIIFFFVCAAYSLIVAGMTVGYLLAAIEQGLICRKRKDFHPKTNGIEIRLRPTRGKGNRRWRSKERWINVP